MNVTVVSDLGEPVGRFWQNRQHGRRPFRVAAPLSSTPLPIYQWIVRHANEFGSWHDVDFLLMDEQVEESNEAIEYISIADPANYESFARRNFLDPLQTAVGASPRVIKPELSTIKTFEVTIDLLILAIGLDGNYANVMPGTPMETGWHIAELTDEYRSSHTKAGSASYEGANFRTHGMSLGPQQVLTAKHVVIIANGPAKRELVKQLVSLRTFDPAFPVSIVHHPDVADRVEMFVTPDALDPS